jgi:hypothetical protein
MDTYFPRPTKIAQSYQLPQFLVRQAANHPKWIQGHGVSVLFGHVEKSKKSGCQAIVTRVAAATEIGASNALDDELLRNTYIQ